MDNTKLIAIGLVVVLLVAGGAAVILLNNDDDSGDDTSKDYWKTYTMPIYGNADGDSVIDANDVKIIQDIIDGKKSFSDYELADANCDGKVTSADLDVVKKIMSNKNTTVHFWDQDSELIEVNYPLSNICTVNADMTTFVVFMGGTEKMAGYISGKYPVSLAPLSDFGVEPLNKGRQLLDDGYNKIKNLDTELQSEGGIGGILVDRNTALTKYVDDIKTAGIPIINIKCTDPNYSIQGSLALGTLMGGEFQTNALSYYTDCVNEMKKVSDALKTVSDENVKKFISMNMTCYVAKNHSQYTQLGIAAGGTSMSDIEGIDSKKMQYPESITVYDSKVDYILNCATMDFKLIDGKKYFDPSVEDKVLNICKSSHFDDDTMVFINMSMPLTCRVVYAAAIMYPEIVPMSEADTFLQYIVDNYLDYLNQNADDKDFDIKTDMTTVMNYSQYCAINGIPLEK